MRVRAEDPGDAEIAALLEQGERYAAGLYPAESNHFLPIDALRQPNVRFVVARNDSGVAIGTGALVVNDDWAEIKRMWVVPEARGKGISKAILADLEAYARSRGAFLLRLETGTKNREALILYGRAGYVSCEPFDVYLPDPLSVFMEKQLL